MRVNSSTRFAAIAVLVGSLACAGNTAREADTDETAAARDTTMSDTLGGQNPPGYRGMERDTTIAPDQEGTDSFLENQGTGQAQDTAGYGGLETIDTTGQQGQTDTTGWQNQQGQTDTTGWQNQQGQTDTAGGAWGADTSGAYQGQTGTDSLPTGDTTGYDPSQYETDTTTSR